ncbi:MAG TPA: spore coat protein [Clostridia bacterium]|nr:spore coat protein [Clostridia bacterium]
MNTQPQEKEWAGTLLYLQKLESTLLCSTALESASDQVRNHATSLLTKSLQSQKNLFQLMNKKGWYKVEAAPKDQYNTIQQSFNTMQSTIQQL